VYDGERGRKEGKGIDRGIDREEKRSVLGIDARREGEEEREVRGGGERGGGRGEGG